MRRIVTSFLVSDDQLKITIIFHRNVEFENVLNIGWWLAAVSACGDPHDLCYLHDTAEGGPWPGQADHRTTIGCSALRGTRMIYLCSFIERPTFTLYRPIHIRSHYPHHSAAGWALGRVTSDHAFIMDRLVSTCCTLPSAVCRDTQCSLEMCWVAFETLNLTKTFVCYFYWLLSSAQILAYNLTHYIVS